VDEVVVDEVVVDKVVVDEVVVDEVAVVDEVVVDPELDIVNKLAGAEFRSKFRARRPDCGRPTVKICVLRVAAMH